MCKLMIRSVSAEEQSKALRDINYALARGSSKLAATGDDKLSIMLVTSNIWTIWLQPSKNVEGLWEVILIWQRHKFLNLSWLHLIAVYVMVRSNARVTLWKNLTIRGKAIYGWPLRYLANHHHKLLVTEYNDPQFFNASICHILHTYFDCSTDPPFYFMFFCTMCEVCQRQL